MFDNYIPALANALQTLWNPGEHGGEHAWPRWLYSAVLCTRMIYSHAAKKKVYKANNGYSIQMYKVST